MYIVNRKTDTQIQELSVNDSRVKQWRTKVALIQLSNPSKDIERLSDILSTTPIMTTQKVSSLDDEISKMIESEINNVNQIVSKIKERNSILKGNI